MGLDYCHSLAAVFLTLINKAAMRTTAGRKLSAKRT